MSTVMEAPAAPVVPVALPALPAPSTPSALTPESYRLSVAQYHAMARSGIFRSGERIELIEGLLVRKMTVNNAHIFATGYLCDLLVPWARAGWFVNCQMPITTKDSEPEPDIAVVRGDRRQFLVQDCKPGPAEIEFLIEVSDSSLVYDQTTKLQLYARANIPRYWIVDVEGHQVSVYSDPTGPSGAPTYQHRQNFVPGQEIPVLLAGQEVGRVVVAELFL